MLQKSLIGLVWRAQIRPRVCLRAKEALSKCLLPLRKYVNSELRCLDKALEAVIIQLLIETHYMTILLSHDKRTHGKELK